MEHLDVQQIRKVEKRVHTQQLKIKTQICNLLLAGNDSSVPLNLLTFRNKHGCR